MDIIELVLQLLDSHEITLCKMLAEVAPDISNIFNGIDAFGNGRRDGTGDPRMESGVTVFPCWVNSVERIRLRDSAG